MTRTLIAETPRLTLRTLLPEDAGFVLLLLNTPGWLRFIGDKGVRNIEDAINYLHKGPFESYEKNGFGLWLVSRQESDQSIGLCGILKRDILDHPDIGFALLPEFAGHGYATEAMTAALDVARDRFGIGVMNAITTPDNELSQKVLRKGAFTFSRNILSEKGEELFVFERDLRRA